jgi:ABC-type nitrate/sulfonate/bicarbonate transport system substrate-binding protein
VGLVLGVLGLSACSAPADPPRGTAAVGTAAVVEGSTAGAVATAPPAPVQASINVPSLGVNHLVYFLGKERGLYAAEGVDMEIQLMPANTGIAALLAGQMDFTTSAGSAARAAAAGNPLRVVMGLIDQSDASLVVAPDIATVQDLRNKTIGVTAVASSAAQIARLMIQAAGLSPDTDVAFVQAPTPSQTYTALLAGGVPAAILSPPFSGQAERAGFRILARGHDYIRATQAGLATTVQRLQEQREMVARTLRGTLRSIDYAFEHEDEMVDFIAAKSEIDREDARLVYRDYTEAVVRNGLTAPDIIKGELELAGADAPIDEIVDYSVLRAVLQEPAFRDLCTERNGARPKGCRTPW